MCGVDNLFHFLFIWKCLFHIDFEKTFCWNLHEIWISKYMNHEFYMIYFILFSIYFWFLSFAYALSRCSFFVLILHGVLLIYQVTVCHQISDIFDYFSFIYFFCPSPNLLFLCDSSYIYRENVRWIQHLNYLKSVLRLLFFKKKILFFFFFAYLVMFIVYCIVDNALKINYILFFWRIMVSFHQVFYGMITLNVCIFSFVNVNHWKLNIF